MLAYSTSLMQLSLDTIIASRFDLMLIAIGIMGYMILFSSRKAHAAKEVRKKMSTTSEDFEVVDTNQGLDGAAAQLGEVLKSIEHGDAAHFITARLHAFLEDYTEYSFALNEVQTILDFCRPLAETDLPDVLFERVISTQESLMLSTFIQFYFDTEQCDKACNVFERCYSTFFDFELDEHMEWRLMVTALKCGRQSLAEHLLQTSQSNATQQVATIQRWWRRTSADMCEARVAHMGSVLNRLSNVFNERFPFEEHDDGERSDDESTCFLGDDSDRDCDTDADSYCDELAQW